MSDTNLNHYRQKDDAFRKGCVKRWKKLILAENAAPIETKHTQEVTAVLLENQMRAFQEAANTSSIWGANPSFGGSITQGDSYAKGDNRLPKMILPMIRRTFPELISNEVVGVQPMSGPISLAFALRYKYDKGPLHEARSAGTLTPTTPYGPSHGVDSLRPDGTVNPPGVTNMVQQNSTVGNGGSEMGYNYLDSSFTGRKNDLFNRTLNPATQAPWSDSEIITTWNTQVTAHQVVSVEALRLIAIGTTVTDTATKAAAQKFLSVTSLGAGKFSFSDQDLGSAALLGDYEATGRIPKAKFTFEKRSVEAGTRRIGSSWSLELEQDIRNMNGIDIETEITSMMSYELQAEIDREMIVRMLYAALSANEFSYWDGSKSDARWMAERDRVFYQFIVQMSNRMAVRNRRGSANFIIATPDVCSLFETLTQYAVMEVNGTVNTAGSGISKVGTLGNGRFNVFRDTRTPVQNNSWINNTWDNQGQYTVNGLARTQGIPDFCLLGYKGSDFWDAGILFCPYIPIMLQRVVDPVSFEPNVGLTTRYGVVDNLFGANLYYHVILIDTLTNTLPPAATPANNFPGSYNTVTNAPFPGYSVDPGSNLQATAQRGGYPIEVVNSVDSPVNTKEVPEII